MPFLASQNNANHFNFSPPLPPSAAFRRRIFSISGAERQNPTKTSRKFQPQQPSKHLLKARETVKQFSNLAPLLSHDDNFHLSHNQAIGLVAASQANFMRVVIQFPPPQPSRTPPLNRVLEGSRTKTEKFEKMGDIPPQFPIPEASGILVSEIHGNGDEFGQLEGSRSSDVQFVQSEARIERLEENEDLNGNRNEFVQLEDSRSFSEKLEKIGGGLTQFPTPEVSGIQVSEMHRNRDEFGSGVQFVHSEAPIEKLEENEDLNGNGKDFVQLEGSRSSGVEFVHSEASIEKLEENEDLNGNGSEFVQVEGSRSSGEAQYEAYIEKLEKNGGGVREVDEGSGNLEAKRGVELLCVVKAVLKKIKRRVLVGDKVLVGSIDGVDRRGMIENVFERKSEVLDPPVANVDHLVVLFSMDQPKIEPFALTRFLVEAESTGIPFFLALNKSELVAEETLVEWKARLRKWGYLPVFCSIESKRGLDTLQFSLRDQTSVIVGPSGVGKSSLINALRGNNTILGVQKDDNWLDPILGSKWLEEQRVGEISVRSGRGKHTTRHVSLLPLTEGGYLADTAGFNQPSLIKVTKQSLAQHFPEIRKMLEDSEQKKCSFSNCLHIGEPGCVVKGDWERYPYYLQLLDEIKIREDFQLRTVGTKREGDVRYKTGEMGVVQTEPRLEMKKHRRQSRKKTNQSIMDGLDEYGDDDDDEENLLDENPVSGLLGKSNSRITCWLVTNYVNHVYISSINLQYRVSK